MNLKFFPKLLLFLIFYLLFSARTSLAAGDFITHYDSRYTVQTDGSAHVEQKVDLTNNQANVYASKYSLTLVGETPADVEAYDSTGPIAALATKEGKDETKILVNLRGDVVGLGKSQSFTVKYRLPGVAEKKGKIWQITLPKITRSDLIDTASTTVLVPTSLGKLAYVSPPAQTQTETSLIRSFTFTKAADTSQTITMAFGEFQIFDFELTYHLQNSQNSPTLAEVALPPDTAYQRVFITNLDPKPYQVLLDTDGNWLAQYKLDKRKTLDIKAVGYVHVYALPQPFPLPQTNPATNLSASQFWQTQDSQIQTLATKLKTPQEIYNYVVGELDYDFSRVQKPSRRAGAREALASPGESACLEYTDLFIALARSAGIPTREINGYGYTTNPNLKPLSLVADLLHAWPEYYDENSQTWVQIDPTWADTTGGLDYFGKLDTEHITFVIHGQDPQYPKPAGDYKLDSTQKDIQVNHGLLRPQLQDSVSVEFKLPPQLLPFVPIKGKVVITNTSPQAIYNLGLNARSDEIRLDSSQKNVAVLPPFGSTELNTNFSLRSLVTLHNPKLVLNVNNDEFTYTMPIFLFFLSQASLPTISILSLILIILLINKYRR